MSLQDGFNVLKIPTITKLIEIELCKFFFKLINDMLPSKLAECVLRDSKGTTLRKRHGYSTRHKHIPNIPFVYDSQYKKSFLAHNNKLYKELQ